ncbi:MAG: ATP-dependent DNA ligase [Acidilobaceae archaeon]
MSGPVADMEFSRVAEVFQSLERVSARTQLALILVKLFKASPPEVIDKVVYLIQGKLGPDWMDIPELGVGEKMLLASLAQAYRVSVDTVEKLFKSLGDMGSLAERLSRQSRQKPSGLELFVGGQQRKLTVTRVFDTLRRVAEATGEGSKDVKIRLLAGLLADAEPLEAKYIVRFVEGRLRLGVGDATILDALAVAFGGGSSARPIVERAYNLRADLGAIAKIVAREGVSALQHITPQPGVPIRPMLAERGKDIEEVMEKVGGRALVEFKYDGERAQIHKMGEEVRIFSRRLENITRMFPDVVEYARRGIRAREAIIEGEIVAYDPETGDLKPFQELMQRKRKHEIDKVMKEVPVKVFLFDALYVDGVDLTVKPLLERRQYLESIIVEDENWAIARNVVTDSASSIMSFFYEAISEGAEGLMIKAIHDNSVYTAGVRGWLWVKFKRDYKSEMIDTVDLVVVGAFYGKGKRGGKLSSLLMAAYDPRADVFKTVCKVATGFTDEELDKMNEMLKPYVIPHKHARVVSKLKPDVWIEPRFVAEILGAELTLSPMHTCGLDVVKADVGISIRFPRFIRWRPDKSPEDATTEDEIVEMYRRQLRRIEEAPLESQEAA